VVIILDIMRTVMIRFTAEIFQLDNFLIIGLVVAVRHILAVDTSLTTEKTKTTEYFNRSNINGCQHRNLCGTCLCLIFSPCSAKAGASK
jgi:hypothetical protein